MFNIAVSFVTDFMKSIKLGPSTVYKMSLSGNVNTCGKRQRDAV